MVQEAVQAVKEAEAKAESIVKEASDEAKNIVDQAQKEAEAKKAEAAGTAKEQMAETERLLEQEGEAYLKQALQEADGEIAVLKADALKKTDEAVNMIISQLV